MPAKITVHCFIVMVLGYYGRGATLKEAAQNCKKAGARPTDRAIARLVLNDDKASVDSQGYMVRAADSELLSIGNGFKLSTLLKLED